MIIIVSGLPRSGTSMMMRMLEAGGVAVLADGARPPDTNNPFGYYELERVRHAQGDFSWLSDAEGKAVKIVSPLLRDLPRDLECRIVFMTRRIDEIVASQADMLRSIGRVEQAEDSGMAQHFRVHLAATRAWLARQPHLSVLYCDYHSVLDAPLEQARQVARFLDRDLDIRRMAQAVDPALARHRAVE